jgi:hypothetical protein
VHPQHPPQSQSQSPHPQHSPQQLYLAKCKVTEDDPAVLFDWHVDVLERFVHGANQNKGLPQAFFITTAPGTMTVTSLLNDFMNLLSRVSGGRNGNNLLAPNTLSQYGNILQVLRDIEVNGWMQQQCTESIPVGSFLATVSHITDRCIANATPIGLVAPQNQGVRQIFQ